MQIKRMIVVGASLVIGLLLTWFIIYVRIPIGPADTPFITLGFGTTAKGFAYSNVVILFISIFCVSGIWLDYFLGTKFLKS